MLILGLLLLIAGLVITTTVIRYKATIKHYGYGISDPLVAGFILTGMGAMIFTTERIKQIVTIGDKLYINTDVLIIAIAIIIITMITGFIFGIAWYEFNKRKDNPKSKRNAKK